MITFFVKLKLFFFIFCQKFVKICENTQNSKKKSFQVPCFPAHLDFIQRKANYRSIHGIKNLKI